MFGHATEVNGGEWLVSDGEPAAVFVVWPMVTATLVRIGA